MPPNPGARTKPEKPGRGRRRPPGLDERLVVGRVSGLDVVLARDLGVELGAEQDRHVGDPQPDEEDDDAGEGAVGLVVGREARHVQREQAEATTQIATANRPPALIHGNRPCFTFGEAQYRIANMKLTTSSSTGHFAMSQTETAEPPTPNRLPIVRARPPVTTTANALRTSSVTITTVIPSRTGIVIQIGRPSSMS